MRRNYANPPIEEALCEIRFVPGQEWDLTVPGRLFATIGNEYSGKPRNVYQSQVQLPPAGTSGRVAWGQSLSAVQLVDSTDTRLITVGPDLLSVHVLRPYPKTGWDEFRPRIERALEKYLEVAKPGPMRRMGVRYINRIEVPDRPGKPDKYFKCCPSIAPGMPNELRSFLERLEYAYPDGVKLATTFATVESSAHKAGYLLDLDVVWESETASKVESAMGLADDLRNRERDAFEALITDELRKLFDA